MPLERADEFYTRGCLGTRPVLAPECLLEHLRSRVDHDLAHVEGASHGHGAPRASLPDHLARCRIHESEVEVDQEHSGPGDREPAETAEQHGPVATGRARELSGGADVGRYFGQRGASPLARVDLDAALREL